MPKRNESDSLGRSLRAGEVTLAEISKLTKGLYWSKYFLEKVFKNASPSSIYDVVVTDGDLVIDGDLRTFKRKIVGLVVNGSLRVSGLYFDADDPATGVFVLGDFHAARVMTARRSDPLAPKSVA